MWNDHSRKAEARTRITWLPLLVLSIWLLAACEPFATSPPPLPTSAAVNAAAQQMQSLAMFDALHGWATMQRSVLRTDDGGAHWQDVTPQAAQPAAERIVAAYLNASTAWVAVVIQNALTTTIYHTSDGGRSWQSASVQAPGIGIVQMVFINAQDGWLLANAGMTTNAEAVTIWRTTDGGQHWRQTTSVSESSAHEAGLLPLSGNKSGLAFLNASTGWAAGSEQTAASVWLYVTHDGGATWQRQTLPLPTGSSSAQIATLPPRFFNAREGVLPVNIYTAGAARLYFYTTHDGGKSWQYGAPLPGSVITWSFISTSQGYATDRSMLYVTRDGGQHWSDEQVGGAFSDVIQLDFISPTLGWALRLAEPAATHILRTSDGGQSWSQIS